MSEQIDLSKYEAVKYYYGSSKCDFCDLTPEKCFGIKCSGIIYKLKPPLLSDEAFKKLNSAIDEEVYLLDEYKDLHCTGFIGGLEKAKEIIKKIKDGEL